MVATLSADLATSRAASSPVTSETTASAPRYGWSMPATRPLRVAEDNALTVTTKATPMTTATAAAT